MSVLFAILLFSMLIFVHELGHFLTAKLSGVQVNEFSMFMGPALWSKKIGETLYSIRLIPIGGYCAMEGEDGDSDNPRSFGHAAWWKRLIILAAGAAMNFIVGVLLMVIIYLPAKQAVVPVISGFESFSTVNGADGLQVGDKILELDGEKIYVQSDFSMLLRLNPGETHDLVVLRDGKKVTLKDFRMETHAVTDDSGVTRQLYGMNFTVESLNLPGKLQYAWNQSLDTVRLVRLSLQMLFGGKVGIQDMSGPVGIVSYLGQAGSQGGSVAAGMKWLQSLNAIIIDPVRCPETAAEFTGYEYLRDARTGEVTNAWPDADNHHIDAVRYALESVWRRRGS